MGKVVIKGSNVTRVDIDDIVYCFSNHASIARIPECGFYLRVSPDINEKSILLKQVSHYWPNIG